MYGPVSDKNACYRDRAAAHLSINQIAGSRSTFGGARRCDARGSHGLFPTNDFPRIASLLCPIIGSDEACLPLWTLDNEKERERGTSEQIFTHFQLGGEKNLK